MKYWYKVGDNSAIYRIKEYWNTLGIGKISTKFHGFFIFIIIFWSIDSLKDANKAIQEQYNQLIQQHIKKQDSRFQKPKIQSSSNNFW